MAGGNDSKDVEPAWHERTSTVFGASVGAVVVLAILFLGVSCVAREFNDPPPPSQYFVDAPASSRISTSGPTTTTTTETITSTSPPVTTDINPGDSTTTTTTTTSGTDTTTSFDPSNLPRTRRSTGSDGDRSSSRRPRFNETRTVYPPP